MTYALRFSPGARSRLRTLGRPAAMRVLAALTALAEGPPGPRPGTAELGSVPGLFRLRLEGQRVACLARGGELLVLAVHAADRR
ncbi:type II toxin-antitoxin system RelE/ParE family toxin [Streptomyces sp. NPDC058374]|uniref:type II toxin-antitoxin system RelE family toxin n=1 Tax=unclassified Streptomyces TaxID=2593676 RepID=UPI00364E39D0